MFFFVFIGESPCRCRLHVFFVNACQEQTMFGPNCRFEGWYHDFEKRISRSFAFSGVRRYLHTVMHTRTNYCLQRWAVLLG